MESAQEKVQIDPDCIVNIKFGADLVYHAAELYPKLRVKDFRYRSG